MALISKRPRWFYPFAGIIERCWQHHGACEHLNLKTAYDTETHEWLILASPVFQEVLGGADDGKQVWTAFTFNADAFLRAPGVFVERFAVSSYCARYDAAPKLVFVGKYRSHPIRLTVLLEPQAGSPTAEIIDTLRNEVRAK